MQQRLCQRPDNTRPTPFCELTPFLTQLPKRIAATTSDLRMKLSEAFCNDSERVSNPLWAVRAARRPGTGDGPWRPAILTPTRPIFSLSNGRVTPTGYDSGKATGTSARRTDHTVRFVRPSLPGASACGTTVRRRAGAVHSDLEPIMDERSLKTPYTAIRRAFTRNPFGTASNPSTSSTCLPLSAGAKLTESTFFSALTAPGWGQKQRRLQILDGLFERGALVDCGRSMLKRSQRERERLGNEVVADRLSLTWWRL